MRRVTGTGLGLPWQRAGERSSLQSSAMSIRAWTLGLYPALWIMYDPHPLSSSTHVILYSAPWYVSPLGRLVNDPRSCHLDLQWQSPYRLSLSLSQPLPPCPLLKYMLHGHRLQNSVLKKMEIPCSENGNSVLPPKKKFCAQKWKLYTQKMQILTSKLAMAL